MLGTPDDHFTYPDLEANFPGTEGLKYNVSGRHQEEAENRKLTERLTNFYKKTIPHRFRTGSQQYVEAPHWGLDWGDSRKSQGDEPNQPMRPIPERGAESKVKDNKRRKVKTLPEQLKRHEAQWMDRSDAGRLYRCEKAYYGITRANRQPFTCTPYEIPQDSLDDPEWTPDMQPEYLKKATFDPIMIEACRELYKANVSPTGDSSNEARQAACKLACQHMGVTWNLQRCNRGG